MNEENQINYYAIIPATVRYNNLLKPSEKLMYGEITALANKMGYCFANNKYFADLYGVTTHTVSQWISHLEKQGYLYTEIIRDEKMEVKERKIYITDVPYVQKNTYPYVLKSTYPMYKNVQYNNINIRIDRLFNYIINNKGEMPKELFCANMDHVYEVLDKFEMLYTEEILANYTQANIEKIKVIIYVLVEIALSPRGEKLNKISRDKLIGIYNRCKQNEGEINNFYDYYITSVINELDKL